MLRDRQRARKLPTISFGCLSSTRRISARGVDLQSLVVSNPAKTVDAVMEGDPLAFRPTDMAAKAARAFERYDLVSLPVVNDRGKLVGRLTVDAVVDFIRVTADKDALAMAGLRGAEDTFAPVWQSARNRSLWLFVNLMTAFAATRFIGLFEATIRARVAGDAERCGRSRQHRQPDSRLVMRHCVRTVTETRSRP